MLVNDEKAQSYMSKKKEDYVGKNDDVEEIKKDALDLKGSVFSIEAYLRELKEVNKERDQKMMQDISEAIYQGFLRYPDYSHVSKSTEESERDSDKRIL